MYCFPSHHSVEVVSKQEDLVDLMLYNAVARFNAKAVAAQADVVAIRVLISTLGKK